jgi:hypothetical protein
MQEKKTDCCKADVGMLYLKHKKEQPPTKWLTLRIGRHRIATLPPVKVLGWFFYAKNISDRSNK